MVIDRKECPGPCCEVIVSAGAAVTSLYSLHSQEDGPGPSDTQTAQEKWNHLELLVKSPHL